MRLLIISNLFPPHVLGGAEMAASSLAIWLVRHGHEVCVLTSAPQPSEAGSFRTSDGILIERRYFSNIYPVHDTQPKPKWKKVIWHLRDHYKPEAETHCREVIEQYKPEMVNIHDLQGLGYNLLLEIARQQLPCVQVLHDFGFLCINMRMFKDGRTCRSRHLSCRASGWLKHGYFSGIRRLSFWSPSEALLARYRPYLPPHLEARCVPLPLFFTPPSGTPSHHKARIPLRLLYVGQLLPTKGVAFILPILASLADRFDFEFTIVGSGDLLQPLREQYQDAAWVRFAGRVAPEAVADFMVASDLMLIPSLWFENSPLVAYQAIQSELPIFASQIGGLPELVQPGVNGQLLPAGDAAAWNEGLRLILEKPELLEPLRTGAKGLGSYYSPDTLGHAVVKLFERTISASYNPTVSIA